MSTIGGAKRILLAALGGLVAAGLYVAVSWIGPAPPPAADAFQQSGCWNTVWGTDNDGYFFTILAGEGCPEYRGRVFAGALQRGPTVLATGGRAKMTGVDACRYPTVEVKAVTVDAEQVLFRFKWTAEQLGCAGAEAEPDGNGTAESTLPEVPAPSFRPEPSGYVPFDGVLITATPTGDGCSLDVSGAGNADFDVTLNGIAKLTNGPAAARPFFSFWIAPEGGNRWTDGAFLAAALTEDCTVQVFRTLEDEAAVIPTTSPSAPTTTAGTTTTGGTTPTTATTAATSEGPASGTAGVIRVDTAGGAIVIAPCGTEGSVRLVCISEATGVWINVDSVAGFGEFHRLDGNTVIYALDGNELRIWVRVGSASRAEFINVFVAAEPAG